MLPLPSDPLLPRIRQAVLDTPAAVVQAPPGSGKTTRVPLALMEALPPDTGRIVLLEPRRIAAVAAARWMARTLGEEVGRTLGYSIRFDSRLSRETRIEVVTEGVLTRRLVADPTLEGVSLVIFDEFHERSLQTDLALALCLDCQRGLREDLRLVVMSATLDATPVARLLGDAPVLIGEGKAFPVEERFLEPERDRSLTDRVVRAVGLALRETAGDILVFLPGAGEIRRAAQALEQALADRKPDLAVFPLYGDLPFAQQERAIRPGDRRRIVLATNIAETSLTIEGIGAVIDSGLSRRLQHDPATGMNRLTTQTVSRAAARQRQGRAGRLGPGVCYRLYSRHTYEALTAYAPPEILTSDLSSLVLELAAWGVVHAAALPWLDPPPEPAWAAARQLLSDLGAIDGGGLPTPLGRAMVRLPLHPRLAGMLLGVDLASPPWERTCGPPVRTGHPPLRPGPGERVDGPGVVAPDRQADRRGDPWALARVDRVAGSCSGS
jgi:ATP-dependent helicase HrpB